MTLLFEFKSFDLFLSIISIELYFKYISDIFKNLICFSVQEKETNVRKPRIGLLYE